MQLASDTFHRADANPISGNWIAIGSYAEPQIASFLAESSIVTGNRAIAAYSDGVIVWPNDQYSEVTLATLSNDGYMGPSVRCLIDGYGIFLQGPLGAANSCYLQDLGGGTTFAIFTLTPQLGDVIRLGVVGNVLTLSQNGTSIGTYTDTSNTFTSGAAGIGFLAQVDVTHQQISAWTGGNFLTPTSGSNDFLGTAGVSTTLSSMNPTRIESPKTSIVGTNLGSVIVG